jgi:hypothetical protein
MFLKMLLTSVGEAEAEWEDDRGHGASQESRTGGNARATVAERLFGLRIALLDSIFEEAFPLRASMQVRALRDETLTQSKLISI